MKAVLLLCLALLATLGSACTKGSAVPDFYGVRLGMTPGEVRTRFTPPGSFASKATPTDYAMTWEPKGTASRDPYQASFEFHDGILVAIRARVPDSADFAKGHHYVVSTATVLRRLPARATQEGPAKGPSEWVQVDELARTCPTHAAEAARIIQQSKAR